jgi:hypothetical protein
MSQVHTDNSTVAAEIIEIREIGMIKLDTLTKHFPKTKKSALWTAADISTWTNGALTYDNEAAIVDFFKAEGDEIIGVLNTSGLLGREEEIILRREKEVRGIKPDIIAIRLINQMPGGDIEGKNISFKTRSTEDPSKLVNSVDVMNHPNILGQIYNQMLVKETQFGVAEPIAILTTLEETRVFWLESANLLMQSEVLPYQIPIEYTTPTQPIKPRSDAPPTPNLETPTKMSSSSSPTPIDSSQVLDNKSPPPMVSSSFSTPIGSSKIGSDDISPPKTGCKLIPVGIVGKEDTETEDDSALEVERPRRMFASKVYTQAESGEGKFLQLLASVFMKMARVTCTPPDLEKCPLCSHVAVLTESDYGWRKANLKNGLKWSSFPLPTAKHFLVWQQLGHGSEGKAFLVSTESGAVAVLKMFYSGLKSVPMNDGSSDAEVERKAWKAIYENDAIAGQVRVVTVDNKKALLMPYFYAGERTVANVKKVVATLRRQFHERGLVHNDVRWRNIGWRKVGNTLEAVVFDMGSVSDADGDEDKWVKDAETSLLSKVEEE